MFRTAHRRAEAGRRPAEGVAPYVLGALGGAALMLLWLKLGALFGLRDVARVEFRWAYLVLAAIGGALVALLAQVTWGYVGAGIVRLLGGWSPARDLRVVWGGSAAPQLFALLVLLPLDLLIVGPDSFTSERLDESLATGWAALSIALAASLGVWSAFILVRGVEVAGSVSWPRAVVVALTALVCLGAIVTGIAATVAALGVAR